MRIAVFVLLGAAAIAGGCKSTQSDAPPKASTYDGEGKPKIKFGDGGTGTGTAPAGEAPAGTSGGSSGGPSVFAYAATPFENIVYLPWKLIGGGGKGAVDGVRAGFSKDRFPFLAAVFSPVNAVVGFLTGAVEGVAMKPILIGPNDSFGHAMAQPTKHATSIWWYE